MTLQPRIYLDHHATTPLDPRVLEAMMPYLTGQYGNAASKSHSFGWEAEEAVDKARKQVATLIGATPKEILFTSGATESDNMALFGVAELYRENGDHIITTNIEHKAVIDACQALEKRGFRVTYLPVDSEGLVSAEQVEAAIEEKTLMVAIMAANNEIGTIQPLAEIGAVAKRRGVLFFTDAAQTVGKLPIDVEAMGIDLLAGSAHKMYGPKGVGFLYLRRKNPRVRLQPLIYGGGHERGMRSGTLNVPGIVGLGEAAEIAGAEMAEETARILALRNKLEEALQSRLEDTHLNGSPTHRLPGNLNLTFDFVEGESLMMGMKNIAVSSGSACTSASLEPSYVLKALGVGDDQAHSSIRFGLGRFTTEAEIDATIERVAREVERLRELSPLYEMAKEGIDLKSVQWTGH